MDERGTRVGAATVVEANAEELVDSKTVTLDRPFVYMLIDCENNVPFFISVMMDTEGGSTISKSMRGEAFAAPLICCFPENYCTLKRIMRQCFFLCKQK